MIVEDVGVEDRPGGLVARTATVRGVRTVVVVPAELSPAEADDATAAFPLALLVAMRLGEDLEVRGRVDAELLARAEDLQRYWLACGDGRLRRAELRVEGTLDGGAAPSPRTATCLSRGVDSLFQAARGGADALLFVDRFEPVHDDAVRARERELAAETAAAIGLPLVTVEAPLRPLVDDVLDWEDAVGAALAWVAHSLAGGLGRLVIPSTDSLRSLAPTGVGPALDPLMSSSRMRLEHGDVAETRMGKVAWLARERPDLLPLVKVCYAENRADNCGRCAKCAYTMACLRAAGALAQATGFPPELDLEAFAAQRHGLLSTLVEIEAVRAAAHGAGDDALAAAAAESLRRSALPRRSSEPPERPSFRALHSKAVRGLLVGDASAGIGLVRAIDLRGRRHVHGAGRRPAGTITAELGALLPPGNDEHVPLWVLPDGRLATDAAVPAGAKPRAAERLRHVVSGHGARGVLRRAIDLTVAPPLGPAAEHRAQPPDGHLYAEPADDRVALWAGEHPVTGDQYTASSAEEVRGAGYADPRLLGHLEARAPLTGRLGTHATPLIPWA